MMRSRSAALALVAALALPPAATSAQARSISDAGARKEVSVTVYNNNLGLVREVRDVSLGQGATPLEFQDVASTVQPETVSVRALGKGRFQVLEQSYRYDLLSPQKLLEKYVGRSVKIYRTNEKTGKDEVHDAEVLSTHGGTILKVGDEITYGYPGRISFPKIPENLIAKPTLEWLVESDAPRQTLEVAYLAGGMRWQADYVLRLDADDARADLTGWVTLQNQSGATYEDARLKLVAGDVRRVQPAAPQRPQQMRALGYAVAEEAFGQESFFEYHLYTLGRPTTLLNQETKQVTLLEASDIPVTKRFVSEGQPRWYRAQMPGPEPSQKVEVRVEFENEERHGLGKALPKGTVRVYKADSEGSEQFVGEDRIDHTPRDEEVSLVVGNAFDLVVDRRQTSYRVLGKCSSESAWEVKLRNHKDEDVTIELLEHAGGDWEIVASNRKAEKKDAFSFEFDVPVEARGESKVTYTVPEVAC